MMNCPDPNITLFFIGNISRGDDAAAPLMLQRLHNLSWFKKTCEKNNINIEEAYQLQPENIYDMEKSSLVLFIDADKRFPQGISFREIYPDNDITFSTHSVFPEQLLGFFQNTFQHSPPNTFLLGIGAKQFELGSPVSSNTEENISIAEKFIKQLFDNVDIKVWQQQIDQPIFNKALTNTTLGGSSNA